MGENGCTNIVSKFFAGNSGYCFGSDQKQYRKSLLCK